MKMFQTVLFVVLSLLFRNCQSFLVQPWLDAKDGCNNPSYWCKNEETAKECGVSEYCKIEWAKPNPAKLGKHADAKPSNVQKTETLVQTAPPVKVTLYYESLCPDCKQFIQYQWYPTYQKLASSGILDLELVPFGNAREYQYGSEWVFYCQHGSAECTGNLIETCGIHIGNNNMTLVAPFIHCMEYYGPTMTNINYCASVAKLNAEQIETCARGSVGNNLEHQMAMKTKALSPAHQYVPWITVNGVHTDQIQNAVQTNMLAYVCASYQGVKPAACSNAKNLKSNVCHKD